MHDDDFDDRPTTPCPPPDEEWEDEITAVESPRALTPVPGDTRPKPRSGQYAATRPPMPGYPPPVPKGAGRY